MWYGLGVYCISFVAHNGFPLCAVVAMPIDPHNTLLNLPHTSTHHEIHTCYPDAVNMSCVTFCGTKQSNT
jgi:hypothetical protein